MRIATDVSIQRPELPIVPFLQPLFPDWPDFEEDSPWGRRWSEWRDVAPDLLELVDLVDADVVVIPIDLFWVRGLSWASRPDKELYRRCRALHDRAVAAGKPVLAFFSGDRSCDCVDLPEAYIFREGPFRSRMVARDRVMPAFSEDLMAAYGDPELCLREREERPVVGFCGLAGARRDWKSTVKRGVSLAVIGARERWIEPSPYLGEELRARAMALIAADPGLQHNFVRRDASVFLDEGDLARHATRFAREYVINTLESDYVLCVHGSGNFSYRLYETISMGRTPVIVETDLAYPAGHRVDWTTIGPVVDQRDIGGIAAAIRTHHESASSDDHRERQLALRQTWLDELSPQGFFRGVAASTFRRVP